MQKNLHGCNLFVTFAPAIEPKRSLRVMKTNELLRYLRKQGCYLKEHGAKHDLWYNPANGRYTRMPRHGNREIKEKTLRTILKELLGE